MSAPHWGLFAPPRFCVIAAVGLIAAESLAGAVTPRSLLLDGVIAGNAVVVVGERGTILRSADNGASWQAALTAATATLTAVAFADDGRHGWAVGHDALILATTDGGHVWGKSWQGGNLQDSFLAVLALDARRVIAVGAYGLFAATDDGGRTWVRRKITDDDFHLNRISRGPTGTLYVAGEHGTLLRSADDGATWTRISAPYDGSFYGILPLDQHTLLAYGLRGRLFRSADDGAAWMPVVTPQPVLLATAAKLRGNLVVLAGQARTLLVSRDYGQTVTPWAAALETAIAEVVELPDGSILALGEAGATVLPKP